VKNILFITILLIVLTIGMSYFLTTFYQWIISLSEANRYSVLNGFISALSVFIADVSLNGCRKRIEVKEMNKEIYMKLLQENKKMLRNSFIIIAISTILIFPLAYISQNKIYFIASAVGFGIALSIFKWLICKLSETK